MTAKEVEAILEKLSLKQQICIAAVNDKASVTISGDKEAIEKVEEYINSENKSIFWRKLATHKAFHSHHMDSIEEKFKERIKKANIKPKRSQTVFVSTTEGRRVEANEIDNDYWWNNLRNPVLFHQCVKKMLENGISVFIEISPRPVLSHYIKAIANQMESDNISVIQVKRQSLSCLSYCAVTKALLIDAICSLFWGSSTIPSKLHLTLKYTLSKLS